MSDKPIGVGSRFSFEENIEGHEQKVFMVVTEYKENEKLLLHPASNMKLLTSAAGLIFLGGDYTFKTSLYHSGVISGDTLYGSIFVEGGLDPDFTTTDLDSMIRSISLLGIKHITENLYADISIKDSLYWGRGWMWDDDPDPSAPYLSALNINDNSIEIFVEGSKIDSPAAVSLTPQTNYVNVINKSITVPQYEENNFEITRDWINRDRKSTRLNSSHTDISRMPSSA